MRILYPSCALPPSLSDSGLFHQRRSRSCWLQGSVHLNSALTQHCQMQRWEPFLAVNCRASALSGAGSSNAWFHPVKPVIALACLFKSKYLSATMPSPFPRGSHDSYFSKKWDHMINKSGRLMCKQWQTVCPSWNYSNGSLDKWPFSLFTTLIVEYIWLFLILLIVFAAYVVLLAHSQQYDAVPPSATRGDLIYIDIDL